MVWTKIQNCTFDTLLGLCNIIQPTTKVNTNSSNRSIKPPQWWSPLTLPLMLNLFKHEVTHSCACCPNLADQEHSKNMSFNSIIGNTPSSTMSYSHKTHSLSPWPYVASLSTSSSHRLICCQWQWGIWLGNIQY